MPAEEKPSQANAQPAAREKKLESANGSRSRTHGQAEPARTDH